jgi:hypothetical protein
VSEASRLAQAQLDAYNAHDIDAFVSCYHPQVQIYDLHSGALTMQGHAAMRERYGKMFQTKPELHATLVNRIVVNNTAVDHERVVGLVDGTLVEVIATYQVEDGVILRVWFAK